MLALCRFFRTTPDVAERQDIGLCTRMMALDEYEREYRALMAPGSRVDGSQFTFAKFLETNIRDEIRGNL